MYINTCTCTCTFFCLFFLVCFSFSPSFLPPLSSLFCLYMCNSAVDSSREPVPDAAAIYFVSPSNDIISRISRDLHSHLYDSYHFNFITPVPRPLLEEIAKAAVDANCVPQVSKVYNIATLYTYCCICTCTCTICMVLIYLSVLPIHFLCCFYIHVYM